ncbi:hypothetical protein DC522_28510 [Microvirga sp. KLBC 81]|uniref:hypothetical protein n=1 Tax=Microvirga sp. KLBC 81 TaxID=1862707 RepID=UPI000D509FB2|nr:hypothetical protein [Microvirga sp. KLBC 81]PVE21089.1 hypothetical protein DC522_28510 [Microvirga sp. KLBC 81]
MIQHMFKVGQVVRASGTSRNLPSGSFRVLRLLPSTAAGIPLYCVKSEVEMIERVVEQHEIEAASR